MRVAALFAAVTLALSFPTPVAAAAEPAGEGPQSVADVYRYLENPELTGEGQEEPHADLRPYADTRAAAADVTSHDAPNPYTRSLNGSWKLKIFDKPDDVPAAFHGADFTAADWPRANVPHTWQSDFVDHPMFRNIPSDIAPDDPPKVPRDVNPTGAYVRTFDLPATWAGGRVMLRFEGVTSNYLVWVNGGYVGYDQGGYTPAEFDITPRLHAGRNRIAVQVHRWGSGAYLEDVDQWRYSGIFRDVWLYRTSSSYLRDASITTDLDASYRDAALSVSVARVGGTSVRGTLLDARGRVVTIMTGGSALHATIRDPKKWSAEEPNLYTLVLELLDARGKAVHITSQPVGFREVEVRDRQVLVNGRRILIKGTNRAETDPDTGRHVTRQAQRDDVELMKRLHLNAVRTSHYPSDPYFYDLADTRGLWIDDEVDIETHSHETCPSNCLADRPEWQAAFADRFRAMVARDKNHPSVIFWDTGNEAGLGAAHYAMAEWADAHEPTRLLYHQSNNPDGDAPFADVDGPRYPTPARLEARTLSSTKPIVMGEYAHAMGNGLGNFDQFWALARKYPQMQGGFIWDWAEQNLRQPLITTPARIPSFFVGKPSLVPGHRGKAVSLSSLDDFVDVFRDKRLDLTGPLTLDAWVNPGEWAGSFPILTKGNGYALQMRDRDTLEFGVDAGGWATASADVPADWYGNWHRVSGVYDGSALLLYIDGAQVASVARTGAVDPGLYEVNLGRNAETQQDNDLGNIRLGRGLIDDARVYGRALTPADLLGDPAETAVLAFDFDSVSRRGDFLSLGISLSGTDGLVGSDRYVQPETAEMAWAQAPVRFSYADGVIRALNEQQAGTLDVTLRFSVREQDRTLRSGTRRVRLAPGASVTFSPGAMPANPSDRERFLTVTAVSASDPSWTLGSGQFPVGGQAVPGILPLPVSGAPAVHSSGSRVVVSGEGFSYRFEGGQLTSMRARGEELLHGKPSLDVWRPPTSNETYDWGTEDRQIWHDLGLDNLTTTVDSVSSATGPSGAVITTSSTVAGRGVSFALGLTYTIDKRGTMKVDQSVVADARAAVLPYLPRVGLALKLPSSMQKFAWYGRGPHENYNDRQSGAPMGVYRSTVGDEYVRYSRPQAYGNHHDARWAALTDGRSGLLVGGMTDVSVTAWDDLDRAEYDHQLPLVRNKDWVSLHALAGETGMGETPNSVLAPYRLNPAAPYKQSLVLRPLTAAEARAGGVPNSDVPAPCPPAVSIDAPATIVPGEPTPVAVTVTPRCSSGLSDVSVQLSAPPGWTVSSSAPFTVTAPAGTDIGSWTLTATVSATSTGGFRTTTTATTTVETPLLPGYGWVSDRPFAVGANGWGPAEKDQSNGEQAAGDGNPLTIAGTAYKKGLGVHAVSTVDVPLGGSCTRFRATAGVDDETGSGGTVIAEVWLDGTRVAVSPTLTGSGLGHPFDVDVTGGSVLQLRVTDAGNGNGNDHADWAAARLACG